MRRGGLNESLERAVNPHPAENIETRVARYLNWAAEAVKSAAQARTQELRDAHLAIASSWMRLAEDAIKKFRIGT
jgi:hypothetical protein